MSTLIETLTSYVPERIARRAATDTEPFPRPTIEIFPAAVLFADISGFTALTERLAVRGAAGAEDLTRLLNAYLGQLVELVTGSGGDVLKFAGDAVLALWQADGEAALPDSVVRACSCALAIQERLHDYAVADDVRFSLKLAIGGGTVGTATLGGVFDRWEFLVAGPPLAQVGAANAHAAAGETIVSSDAWALVAERCTGEAAPGGNVKLEVVREPAAPVARTPVVVPEERAAALRAFIPAAIRNRLDAGQSDWLAELRRLTVLFVNLPDLTEQTDLESGQEMLRTLQGALYRYEGSINKLSIDDKGASLLAAFGLPPLTHEDDPTRGVLAAFAMHEALGRLGFRCSIGVTTGLAFCGSVGGEYRREYTIMGDVVNLAARLMQAAMGGILCDRPTATAAGDRLVFEPLVEMKVKGKKDPIAVFKPESIEHTRIERSKGEMVGREHERELLAGKVRALVADRTSGRILVEGEAGIGKSRLVEDLLAGAREAGAHALAGGGDSIDSATPYFAWRRVFVDLFGLDEVAEDRTARREHVLHLLPEDPAVVRMAPLLDAVLPLDWEDNEITAELAGKPRADATHELLARLLTAAAEREPLVLVIEDAHWLDSGSLALVDAVAERVRPMLLVVASRPMGAQTPAELTRLAAAEGTETLRLETLPPEATIELVRRRLGIQEVPAPVAEIVRQKAEGNPFFAEELAYAMRDTGLLLIEDGACRIAPGGGGTAGWKLPDTVQGVVTSRIDRLSAAEQLTMKVASVIGRAFTLRALRDIHPIAEDRDRLGDHFDVLDELDLTPLERPAPELEYVFKHIITQEVAYNLLSFEQRRHLHRAVAEWHEREHAANLEPFYPYLAHHWKRAAEDRTPDAACLERAIDYLHRAGDIAVRAYVNQEAIGFYSEGLTLLASLPESHERDRRELRLQLALGAILIATRGYAAPEVEHTYERARALCESEGDDALLFAALRGLWAFHTGRAEYRQARELGLRLQELAEKHDDVAERMEAHRALGNTAFWFGEFAEAREQMERGIELYAPDRDRRLAFLYGQDPDVANRGMQTWPLALTGQLGEALARGREAVARAREVAHPYSLGYALVHDMCCHQYLGLVDEALDRANEAVGLATERSFPNWMIAGMVIRGWALARKGRAEEGIAQIRMMTDVWRSFGSELCVPYFLALAAEACGAARQFDDGLAAIDDALGLAARNDDRWYEAEIYRLAGDLHRGRGDGEGEAEAHYRKALDVARAQGARLLELRTAVSLARLGAADGRDLVASALTSFPDGLDLPDLAAARSVL